MGAHLSKHISSDLHRIFLLDSIERRLADSTVLGSSSRRPVICGTRRGPLGVLGWGIKWAMTEEVLKQFLGCGEPESAQEPRIGDGSF